VVGPDTARVKALSLSGDRGEVRARSVLAVLALLAEALEAPSGALAGEEPPSARC